MAIKCLTEQTAASVRGSQVIGSIARAVEELVHNSVEGCAKSIAVTLGRSKLVISDDGLGIDPSAMRLFIGTEYCSNSSNAKGRKGETLRSIASLCVEMKIETACCAETTNDRKRKLDTEASKTESNGSIICSEKLFKNGVVVSFKQSTGGNTASSAIIPALNHPRKEKAGTAITIRGLFHQHAVRRKQYSFAGEEKAYAAELAQIRTCLRLLALSYPNIAFELRNGSTGKVDCSFESPEWNSNYAGPLTSGLPAVASASPSLSVESRALILRLRKIHPKEFSKEHSLPLEFEESRQTLNSNGAKVGSFANSVKGTNFRIFGALCISSEDNEEAVRNKELELVVINGRLATQNDKLADIILSHVTQCKGTKPNCSVRFFIHVSTRTGELVVKDSVATTSLPEMDRLAKCLKRMVAKAVVPCDGMDAGSQSSAYGQNSSCYMNEKKVVNGERMSIMSSALHDAVQVQGITKRDEIRKPEDPPPSPFSSAFFETDKPSRNNNTAIKSKAKPDDDSRLLSFEDAFLDSPTKNIFQPVTNVDFDGVEDSVAASRWTKQRVKGLEGKIAAVTEATTGSQEKISLTKDMLAEAEVIAQVEEKFIIIKARGVLLCVDQHAADERIALEKLERALFDPEVNAGMDRMVHMTHKSLKVSDILKCRKLIPPRRINLSQKDMATVRQNWSLIQKWKFTFEELDEKTLFLTGLASVCDRVASTNDFVGFVKELGHFTGGKIKPAFVKNVLASNACRYAIMFGDSMTHEQCIQLIASLSKCEFCFICAHGRPSVIPLIDMNKVAKSTREVFANENGDTRASDGNLRSGPKRVVRR